MKQKTTRAARLRSGLLIASLACLLAAGCAFCGCSAADEPAEQSTPQAQDNTPAATEATNLRLVTGGEQGVYCPFGRELAAHATAHAGIAVDALVSDGAKANLEALEEGLAEFALCQSNVIRDAYEGVNAFESNPLADFSVLAVLYPEYVQIVTTDPEIKTLSDLEGKKVSLGAPHSGTYISALDILAAYGLSERDIQPTYQTFGDSMNSLERGQIDAAFIVAGAPTPALVSFCAENEAFLLSIDQEHLDSLCAEHPSYAASTIAAGTYEGIDTDTTTVALQTVLAASNKVSEDDAYALVKDLFDAAADSTISVAFAERIPLDATQAASFTGVAYHLGAMRYFDEQAAAEDAAEPAAEPATESAAESTVEATTEHLEDAA